VQRFAALTNHVEWQSELMMKKSDS